MAQHNTRNSIYQAGTMLLGANAAAAIAAARAIARAASANSGDAGF